MVFSGMEHVVYNKEKRDAIVRPNKQKAHLEALAYQINFLTTDYPIPLADISVYIGRAFLKMNMKLKRMMISLISKSQRFS